MTPFAGLPVSHLDRIAAGVVTLLKSDAALEDWTEGRIQRIPDWLRLPDADWPLIVVVPALVVNVQEFSGEQHLTADMEIRCHWDDSRYEIDEPDGSASQIVSAIVARIMSDACLQGVGWAQALVDGVLQIGAANLVPSPKTEDEVQAISQQAGLPGFSVTGREITVVVSYEVNVTQITQHPVGFDGGTW